MPPWAHWLLFALAGLAMIVGAKALDDRDRRRFGAPGPDAPGRSGEVPTSDPPSGAFHTERASLAPDAPPSDEIPTPDLV